MSAIGDVEGESVLSVMVTIFAMPPDIIMCALWAVIVCGLPRYLACGADDDTTHTNDATDTLDARLAADGSNAASLDTRGATQDRLPAGSRIADAVKGLNAGLGEIVALLARDPVWKHAALADLEWLVYPPVTSNQLLTLRGKVKGRGGQDSGVTVPLGVALWAKVSEDVDARLKAQQAAGIPFRIAPRDWTSGEIPWVLVVSGPEEVRKGLHARLRNDLGDCVRVFGPPLAGVSQ